MDARECEIKRALSQRPEISVVVGESQRPSIFKLLSPPDFRHAVGVRTGTVLPDRGVDVESVP